MRGTLKGAARACLGISVLLAGIAALPASAHHSFALFDTEKTVELEGTVKKFDWSNPHSWIVLEVLGASRNAEQWMIELPSAGVLAREGWNKNYVKPGEKISVMIHPLKNGTKGGSLASFAPDSDGKP